MDEKCKILEYVKMVMSEDLSLDMIQVKYLGHFRHI